MLVARILARFEPVLIVVSHFIVKLIYMYTPSQWGNYTTIACSITQSGISQSGT